MEDLRDEWNGIVPVPSGVTEEFWDATTEGRLVVQRCPDCDEFQFYPRSACIHCDGRNPTYVDTEGTGEVFSFTVCHVPGAAGFDPMTPYAVAIIELTEGPRMTARITSDPDLVAIGAPVEVRFQRVADRVALPVFKVAHDQ